MIDFGFYLLAGILLAASGFASVKYGFQKFGTFLLFCSFLTAMATAGEISVLSAS